MLTPEQIENLTGKKILVSVSGGETSALMAILMKISLNEICELCYVFANTGQENEETLEFVNVLDKYYDLGIVWVEAAVKTGRKSTGHKVVDFETACRDLTLFIQMSSKYGLPNPSWPHCTRELKQRPIHSYVRNQLGWETGAYLSAIGIRTDESRRAKTNEYNPIYPLIELFPRDKQDVKDFWEDQPFHLNLKGYQGNCKWCWKKSDNKHFRLIKENLSAYYYPMYLEKLYDKAGHGVSYSKDEPTRVLFRKNRSTEDMIRLAELADYEYLLKNTSGFEDNSDGCSSSCEFIETE